MCLLRKIVYVLAVFIILLLVSPYFSGMIVKNRITKMVSNLSSSPAFDVILEDYTEGWRDSSANFTVSVFNPFMEYRATRAHSNLALKFNVICYITHGPVLLPSPPNGPKHLHYGQAFVHCDSSLAPNQNFDAEQARKKAYLESDTIMYFDGSIFSKNEIHDLLLHLHNADVLFGQLKSTVRVTGGASEVSSKTKIDNVNINLASGDKVTLGGVGWSAEINKSDRGIWTGDRNYNINNVIYTEPDGEKILNDIKVFYRTLITGNVVNKQLALNIAQVTNIDKKSVGPVIAELDLNNLDLQALAKIMQIMHTWIYDPQNLANDSFESAAEKIQQLLPGLLSHGFRANLKQARVEFPHGEMNVQAYLTLPEAYSNAVTLADLINSGDGALVITVPKIALQNQVERYFKLQSSASQAVTETDKSLAHLVRGDVLVEGSANYTISLDYKNQQFYLNAKKLDSILDILGAAAEL